METQSSNVYTILLFSQRIYVVNSTKLINAVHRSHRTLQYAPLASSFTANLAGCSPRTRRILKQNTDLKGGTWGLYHDSLTAIHDALGTGKRLDKSNFTMMTDVFRSCEGLHQQGDLTRIDLADWIRHVVTSATSDGIYGPQSPLRSAENEKHFWSVICIRLCNSISNTDVIIEGPLRSIPRGFCRTSFQAGLLLMATVPGQLLPKSLKLTFKEVGIERAPTSSMSDTTRVGNTEFLSMILHAWRSSERWQR